VTLDPQDVHVHYSLIGEVDAEARDAAMQTLSSTERDRAHRFVFERDRLQFIVAHGLLRRALSTYAAVEPKAWRFVANQFGKPALADDFASTNIAFNLTHTDGMAACVITRGDDVGIDVEATDRRTQPLDLATRYFSPFEVADLHACPESERQVRFIEIWTLKEAYVKAVGMGLSHSLQTFSFRFDGESSICFESSTPSESSWGFRLFAPSGRHRLAVAVRGRSHRVIPTTSPDGPPAALLRTSV
jgi:4'-phosphopantetheinyl transferase